MGNVTCILAFQYNLTISSQCDCGDVSRMMGDRSLVVGNFRFFCGFHSFWVSILGKTLVPRSQVGCTNLLTFREFGCVIEEEEEEYSCDNYN